jgi:hypothetical protein
MIPNISQKEIDAGRLRILTKEDHYRLDCLIEEVEILAIYHIILAGRISEEINENY